MAPPSAAYFPVSSFAPKSTAPAVAANVSAHEQRERRSQPSSKCPFLLPSESRRFSPAIGRSTRALKSLVPRTSSGEHRVEQRGPAPNRTGSSATRPVSAAAPSIAARAASSSSSTRVERDRRHRRRARGQRRSARAARPARRAAGSGGPGSPRSRSGRPGGRGRSACGAEPCTSPSVTPEYGGMDERALALDPEQLSPALVPLDDEPLGRAGDEVRDDRVDGDPPARRSRSPSGRSGRTASASPRARAARSSSSETVIFPIAHSEPTVRTIFARHLEVRAGRDVQTGRRPTQVAQLDAVPRGQPGRAPRRRRGTRAARSRRRARSRCTSSAAPATRAGSGRPGVATPTSAVVGLERERLVDRADDRDAVLRLARARRVEDRDDGPLGRSASTPRAVLP